MIGYFMIIMLTDTGWNFMCCKEWKLHQLQLTIRWWKVDMATSYLLKLIQARKNF